MEILRICLEEQLLKKYCMIAFNIAKNPKYPKCVEYQRRIASMFYKFFNINSFDSAFNGEIISNQCPLDLACVAKVCDRNQKELAEELRKSIIRNLKSEKCTHLLGTIFRVLI